MQLDFISKLKKLSRNWIFWLIIITALAIFIRSIPAWTNAAWGADFGIYYGLTNSLVKTGDLFNPYTGWGSSYQYFPVLYAVTGIGHWITGIDTLTLMSKIAPIFGGLSVLIFYFVVYELIGDRKIAILSSLFLAVLPFHVYQTSHAAPLTMGHFFMMLSLYLFIKYRQDAKYLVPLFISTILLIMSHHLTTYFYLISLIFIVFFENAGIREWTTHVKRDALYILLTSGLIFSYWAFIATPVYESFMKTGIRIGPLQLGSSLLLVLFYTMFFLSFGVIWLKRRYNLFIERKEPSTRSSIIKFSITLTICFILMGVFSIIKMPWTNFSFTPLSIIYSIPLIIMFGFGVAGFRYTRFIKNGGFVRGWLLAILVSLVYGTVTNSGVILPDRHFEYMMAPLSIIAVYGIGSIFLNVDRESLSKRWSRGISHVHKPRFNLHEKTRIVQKRQIIYLLVVVLLVTTNAVSVYPSHVSLKASYEGITNEDVSVIEWMDKNLDKNTSIIASDHRLARMAEALGFNTTIDEAIVIWDAKNFTGCINEICGIGENYSRITHVVIDDVMKDMVVHVGAGKIVYMTNETSQEAYEKFSQQPFELIYRNETIDPNTEIVLHWAEVYQVNWTYIERLSLI
jgi:hypothetical protein